ncbi:MAG: TraR/DksA C4-type zinc finger protein [Verrucomicrobia bacterium]|nr:TraR/DksA C4-type zinc finger protein [Verrucomicrobiota bacterium]
MAKPKNKVSPRAPAKKLATRKPSAPAKKTAKPAAKTASTRTAPKKQHRSTRRAESAVILAPNHKERKLDPFVRGQKEKLLHLRDAMVDSMAGVAQDTLRARAEGSEASAFGMHQADAGSDAYDRDFALSLLSQEQDALYEIDQALKRIELGTYGTCEMSGKQIPRARLEAIPFARFTVECQSQLEKQSKQSRVRQSVTSLFGLTEDEGPETEEEEAPQPAPEKE